MRFLSYFWRHRWPAWFYTALVVLACSWPGNSLPPSPAVGFDKVVHAGMFAGWALLWLLQFPRQVAAIVALGIVFGIGLEFYQQWLPFERTFDWCDAVADAVGTLIGMGFYYLLMRPAMRRQTA